MLEVFLICNLIYKGFWILYWVGSWSNSGMLDCVGCIASSSFWIFTSRKSAPAQTPGNVTLHTQQYKCRLLHLTESVTILVGNKSGWVIIPNLNFNKSNTMTSSRLHSLHYVVGNNFCIALCTLSELQCHGQLIWKQSTAEKNRCKIIISQTVERKYSIRTDGLEVNQKVNN